MAWATTHDLSAGIIEVIFSGNITDSDLKEAAIKRVALQKETGIAKILISGVGTKRLRTSVTTILELPDKMYPELGVDRKTRLALLMPESDQQREAVEFFETACINRGWNARIFSAHQAAIDWLQNEPASS